MYYQDKYPAHSTARHVSPPSETTGVVQKPRKGCRPHIVWSVIGAVFIAIAIAIAIFGSCAAFMQAVAPLGHAAEYVLITDGVINTKTPEPSATTKPTRTPYPTPTHTPRLINPTAIVQPERIIVTVLHIITATPEPTQRATMTATSTPNATQTQAAFDQKIANSKELRLEFILWTIKCYICVWL